MGVASFRPILSWLRPNPDQVRPNPACYRTDSTCNPSRLERPRVWARRNLRSRSALYIARLEVRPELELRTRGAWEPGSPTKLAPPGMETAVSGGQIEGGQSGAASVQTDNEPQHETPISQPQKRASTAHELRQCIKEVHNQLKTPPPNMLPNKISKINPIFPNARSRCKPGKTTCNNIAMFPECCVCPKKPRGSRTKRKPMARR